MPGYEGLYEVSNLGRIRSFRGIRGIRREKILKPQMRKDGYLNIALWKNKSPHMRTVHRLILFVFSGPSDLHCNHKNGIKTDNRLENLEYCTRQENMAHAARNGLSSQGERNGGSKLTANQVRAIRASSKNQYDVAEKYGVSQTTISGIKTRRYWKHID